MLEINNKLKRCDICRDEYTSIHTEVARGMNIYVCNTCLEAAKYNFIWICMNCGKVYIRNKELVLARMKNRELKRAYLLCKDMQLIQGIDRCIDCDPEGILFYMDMEKVSRC